MGQSNSPLRRNLLAAFLIAGLASGLVCAQEPEIPTLRGNITAMQQPDGFDVGGYHVVTSSTTQFFELRGPKKDPGELRRGIRVGTYVQVIGDRDRGRRTVIARQVKVRDEGNFDLSGLGVIDRMITSGSQTVFRADGYVIRLSADAELHFSGGLKTIDEIGAGTWVRYEGRQNNSGELISPRAEFIRPKPRRPKRDPAAVMQFTTFPPGSIIDYDGSFSTQGAQKKAVDTPGGACGWYRVPDVPVVQEHVRRVGMKMIPQYQRDLPDDSPEKIPFRFYLVEEKSIRSDLSCYEGLVLVPVNVINRLQNEDQFAAVIADGVAASLQRQQARLAVDLGLTEAVELAAYYALRAAGGVGGAAFLPGAVIKHEIVRKMEDQRGRVALGLMADAGYDPWQAPEAWRLLEPKQQPKNPSRLKYPGRAGYQLEILGMQCKAAASGEAATQTRNTAANPN